MTFAAGTTIARDFEIIRPLGGEGGRTFLARDKALQREVVLKFQADATSAAHAALLAEAALLARCDHPSVVPFYRIVSESGTHPPFNVMRAVVLADAEIRARFAALGLPPPPDRDASAEAASRRPLSLRDLLAPGFPLPEEAVHRLGREIAEALVCLHGLSPPAAHRAVSPGNILFDTGGRAVLVGFGKARSETDAAEAERPAPQSTAAADDILALGRVLHEALAGCRPVGAAPCDDLSGLRGLRLSGRWLPLLGQMLAPRPEDRPTAREVVACLAAFPRGHRRLLAWISAATLLAAAALPPLAFFASAPSESVLEETLWSVHATNAVFRSRLPPFTREVLRRIPEHWQVLTFDSSIAESRRFQTQIAAFNARNSARPSATVWQGTVRSIRLPGDVRIEMVGVPRGAFRRGYFSAGDFPSHQECVVGPETVFLPNGFWMARTELTRAQYAAVMRVAPAVPGFAARRLRRNEGRKGRPLEIEGGDLPVGEDLDLADVERFLDALNALAGLEGARRFRLPTEAEWELACRAFVARPFEGAENAGDVAWTRENSGGVPHPVAQKDQNPLGLFDMHGNLAEWCVDAYAPYTDWPPFAPVALPVPDSAPRVVRGGSFRDGEASCGSDARASARTTDKGFAIRLVAFP